MCFFALPDETAAEAIINNKLEGHKPDGEKVNLRRS
jgi:hypothetical protein